MTAFTSVAVFDLGGVLIDWNPRHLYRKLFEHEVDMEHFLANVCTTEWNLQQDAGRNFAEASAALKREHPGYADMIDAWFERFDEMMAGPIARVIRKHRVRMMDQLIRSVEDKNLTRFMLTLR